MVRLGWDHRLLTRSGEINGFIKTHNRKEVRKLEASDTEESFSQQMSPIYSEDGEDLTALGGFKEEKAKIDCG